MKITIDNLAEYTNSLRPSPVKRTYHAVIQYAGPQKRYALEYSPEQEASIQRMYDEQRAKGSPSWMGD